LLSPTLFKGKDESVLMCNFVSCRDISEVEAEQKMLEEVSFLYALPSFLNVRLVLLCKETRNNTCIFVAGH